MMGDDHMKRLLSSIVWRLSIASICCALIIGSIWSWQTTTWRKPQDFYFYTLLSANSDDDSVAMDMIPFGFDGDLNIRLIEHVPIALLESAEKQYVRNCGSIFDDRYRPKYRDLYLCNAANLQGNDFDKAVAKFHEMADKHISDHWIGLIGNVFDKILKSIFVAIIVIFFSMIGMWIFVGKIYV
jgi:hypothetical protein